ncbi:hypothetical protein O0L34_g3858 [Tuta absoluta]|nr:hypothetical protein O0L34_g3858 [Tuta absoluta]
MTEQEANGEGKTEDSSSEPTELENSIIRQVEYYFGDVNIVRDKFMSEQMKLDEGWIPLDVMLRFNRLAKMSTDVDVIVNALNKSTSGLLEISEDKKKVRRHPDHPIPEMNEERRKELMARTIYAKGFPKDSVLDDILKFFHSQSSQADVENVVMRRYVDRKSKQRLFKGSVFATFKSQELAQKFLETKDLKYNDTVLELHTQEAYIAKKQEEYNERKEKKDKKNKNKSDNQATKEQEARDSIKLPTGTVLHFAQDSDNMKREDVHEALTKLGADIAYIDFKLGDKEGWVRLSKENQAKEVFGKITDGTLKVGNVDVTFKLVEGDEETKHLEKTVDEMIKRRKNQKNFRNSNRQGNNRGGKGKPYFNRKRKQDGDNGPAAKVKAS